MDDALRTLFYPFEKGAISAPGQAASVLFLGARPGFSLPEDFPQSLHLVQGFRSHFLSLLDQGFRVTPTPEGAGYDVALVLCDRHRERSEAFLAEAARRTRPGGLIVIGGSKADGVASLKKRIEVFLPLAGSLSKYHGISFWFARPGQLPEAFASLDPVEVLVDGRFATAPGSFSRDGIDPGSALLARNLPVDLAGDVADFAAGWGYLSSELMARGPQLARLDLYEADYASLEAARRNLANSETRSPLGFFWLDLVREPVTRSYDGIVMNPPFHTGRAAEPELGRKMIESASRALKPNGRLILVANRQLPYEKTMASHFPAQGEILHNDSFKILWGRR